MSDYIKREEVLQCFTPTEDASPFACGISFALRETIRRIPLADVVSRAEYDKMRRALAWMWYAYVNKDGECPHDFERQAVEMAEEVLGKWEDCMPQLMFQTKKPGH